MPGSRDRARARSRPGHDEARVAIRRVGLPGIGHRAVVGHRAQPVEPVPRGLVDPLVAFQHPGGLAVARVRHLERQRHVALLERPVVRDGVLVLPVAPEHHVVLLLRRDLPLARDRLGGVDHPAFGVGIVGEVAQHPVLVRAGAARRVRRGIVDMRAVRRPVARHRERDLGTAGLDLLARRLQAARAGRAGMVDRGAGNVVGAHHPGHPRQTEEALLLRHRQPEHAVIDLVERDAAALQLAARGVGEEFHAVQMREPALPARERRAPVNAVGNVSVMHGAVPPVSARHRRVPRYGADAPTRDEDPARSPSP